MNDKEKKFIETVNIDKARNKTKICIVLSSISLLTYVLPLIYGDFDFGIVFEVLTFVFMLLASEKFRIGAFGTVGVPVLSQDAPATTFQ